MIGIIGYGQIGRSVAELVISRGKEVEIFDPPKGYTASLGGCDYVHVCVPADAVDLIFEAQLWSEEAAILLHTTVVPGTCRRLAEKYEIFTRLYHLPVRGKHPHLAGSLRTFRQPIGHWDPQQGNFLSTEVGKYVMDLGMHPEDFGPWENSELAKIMSTARLGWDVLFIKHLKNLCTKYKADFRKVHTEWTRGYNDGYEEMGSRHFRRSVLEYMPGPIGGHCVMENAELMRKEDSYVAALLCQNGGQE